MKWHIQVRARSPIVVKSCESPYLGQTHLIECRGSGHWGWKSQTLFCNREHDNAQPVWPLLPSLRPFPIEPHYDDLCCLVFVWISVVCCQRRGTNSAPNKHGRRKSMRIYNSVPHALHCRHTNYRGGDENSPNQTGSQVTTCANRQTAVWRLQCENSR